MKEEKLLTPPSSPSPSACLPPLPPPLLSSSSIIHSVVCRKCVSAATWILDPTCCAATPPAAGSSFASSSLLLAWVRRSSHLLAVSCPSHADSKERNDVETSVTSASQRKTKPTQTESVVTSREATTAAAPGGTRDLPANQGADVVVVVVDGQ